MSPEMIVLAILVTAAIAGVVGHWIGSYPGGAKAAESNAIAGLRSEVENISVWWDEELSKLREAVAKHGATPTPAAESAPTASPAPVQAIPVAGWALGTSYTSPLALLEDVKRPDFPPVRIDGEQKAGVTGFDFYTLADGSVSQTKPAA